MQRTQSLRVSMQRAGIRWRPLPAVEGGAEARERGVGEEEKEEEKEEKEEEVVVVVVVVVW